MTPTETGDAGDAAAWAVWRWVAVDAGEVLAVRVDRLREQVADHMFISVHTVAFHLRQVFRKLGISSRVELAHRRGTDAGAGAVVTARW
jgi:hypothetical protein